MGELVHLQDGEQVCSKVNKIEDESKVTNVPFKVPCDMVVLSTNQEQGQCYVMTANLDGETSLKTRSGGYEQSNKLCFIVDVTILYIN